MSTQHCYFLFAADDNLKFIVNWLEEFPQYKNSDFFITGESYAGNIAYSQSDQEAEISMSYTFSMQDTMFHSLQLQ